MDLNCSESYGTAKTPQGYAKSYAGEVEFEVRDARGRILKRVREPNIVKIFAKEILAHRLPHSKIWDPTASAGSGAWVSHNIDLDDQREPLFLDVIETSHVWSMDGYNPWIIVVQLSRIRPDL